MPVATKDTRWFQSTEGKIAVLAVVAIVLHVVIQCVTSSDSTVWGIAWSELPLLVALVAGGFPLVWEILQHVVRREFSADILAGISIVTAVLLGQYLAGTLVVLMLSGGQALESYAVRSASSVLHALAQRMPSLAHRKVNHDAVDVPLQDIVVGDLLIVFPHEICPVDGEVVEGHGSMDESYLTGEPYVISKAPGSAVLSGAINGESVLTVRAEKRAIDSRYAKIMEVMRESEQRRPKLRRLGDQLGAVYTPLAIAIAVLAWLLSSDPHRFLAVVVVATPCPLLIAIPVAIIGSVSLAARQGIIIKDPTVLEKIETCQTAMFDKTGTLTYGRPMVTEILPAEGGNSRELLAMVASVERYSRHPLASAVVTAAHHAKVELLEAEQVSERPGQGLRGIVHQRHVQVTGRKQFTTQEPQRATSLPPLVGGMECVVLIDGDYAGLIRFRDEPRADGRPFIRHLRRRHRIDRVLLVSGDQEREARYLADKVGIQEVHAGQSPEQKLSLVQRETKQANTLFMGDGINDAPALAAATVGIAFGQGSDITTEAAGAVILDSSLERVDALLHIGRRMRKIALQSAVVGMGLSVIGMLAAAAGYLPPVAGAITQEIIDVVAVVNALRAALPPNSLTDY